MNSAQDVQTPKMLPTLAAETLVYFLAESPGADEDTNTGRPLTGPSGKLLRGCIPDGEEQYCSFDNVVNCRPTKNRNPLWNEIECCRPRRWKYIEQAKPKLIVGLGMIPLHATLGSMDLQGMRGRFFAVKIGTHECWYMPTYHPSFILRTAYDKKKPLQSKLGHCFRMDIQRAFANVGKLKEPHIDTEAEIRADIECFDGSTPEQFEALRELLTLAAEAPLKAIDIETKGLRPFSTGAAVMSAAISTESLNFSFAIQHPQTKWTPKQLEIILSDFALILEDTKTTKVAHNLPFEMEWFIWLYGKSIAKHEGWECTQMQAHFLDERKGKQARGDDDRKATYQSLNFLGKQHFGVAYKSLFKLDKKDMSKSPLGEMLIYGGVDAKYTLRLFLKQERELEDRKLYDAYWDALPRQVTVAMMQTLGVGVDQKAVSRLQEKMRGEIEVIVDQIKDLKVVKAYMADNGEFNPLSNDHGIKIFRDYLKRKEVEIEPGKFSVDKHVLERIDHPLAKIILDLRNRSKLKSTYIDVIKAGEGEQIYPDGLIHCNFNTTFTETGRTSSDEINLQNFPSRNDSWVRQQVIGGKGRVLLAFDYSQLEACTAAMCSKDKVLIKALWEDYDIHAEWSQKLYARYPLILGSSQSMDDPKVAKKLRSLVKNKLTFPAIFGAQNKSIAGYLGVPEDVIDDLMDEFWKTFFGLADWQRRLMQGYYNTGFVSSPLGRQHKYPLTKNQAINFPIQSFACDIVCNAMVRLSEMAIRTGKWYLHPIMNIHDDLSFSVPDDDKIIEESIKTISKIMLTPPYEEHLNVPLAVKASVGPNWYEMTEVTQLWSNRDV